MSDVRRDFLPISIYLYILIWCCIHVFMCVIHVFCEVKVTYFYIFVC